LEKRKSFLKAFLGALSAKEILWVDIQPDKIYGTVIYDQTDPDERQDFVWHITEDNVPGEEVKNLLDYLSNSKLIDIDKIVYPIAELNIYFIEKHKLESVWKELFNIEVRMIDDGEETDSYFIHD
jgi:hypothetical protein